MTKKIIQFSSSSTTFYFDASFENLETITSKDSAVILTDEHVFSKHKNRFQGWQTIVVKAGEQNKNQTTVDDVIGQMILFGADRETTLIGVGGGVITDMAGYISGVYMRGIPFGFVPTSILAMVDACIGGKNGVDVGVYKNMVGLIRQPSFLLYDYSLLKSLPEQEWINGFAEIIKHAAIKDAAMFKLLEKYSIKNFQKDSALLNKLIQRNAMLKSKVVKADEFEMGDRKLLNFGHTLGHAIENDYSLPHGFAIAIGMVAAAHISERYTGFTTTEKLVKILKKYSLPTGLQFNTGKALQNMMKDKKRFKKEIHYVLLEKIGKAVVKPLSMDEISPIITQFFRLFMNITIQPSPVSGNIVAPASKSSMQRACAAALVRNGESIIRNPGISNDDIAALSVIKSLGAIINQQRDGSLQILSEGIHSVTNEINCGESGLGIRMFAPIIALSEQKITINGEGSLLFRPMNFFDEIFPELGIEITSNNGKLPIQLQGPLQPENITIDGSLSSQFLTGLLLAYSAVDANNVTITVTNLKSKPYINLTLQVMEAFGLNVPINNNYEAFEFIDNQAAVADNFIDYTVEGDWSGGAFLLVAGAIAGNITVKGLDISSTQADGAILQALMNCGAKLSIQTDSINIGNAPLQAFHFDATDCPDLFPPLVALAAYCNGKTIIEGVHRLAHKESNRALTLQDEFAKMGVLVDLQDNTMIVHGGNGVKGAVVHSRHDHRIAMACAVAALKAEGETTIEEAEAINKSYPNFYEHLKSLGAHLNGDLG